VAEANLALGKLPPQNLEAEQAVLGGVLIDNSVLPQVVEILQAQDFYRSGHRRIFEAMVALFERDDSIDLITVREILEQKNHLEDAGGTAYLASLIDMVPTAANVSFHSRIVREKALLRGLISTATEIASQSYEGSQDVEILLDEAERRIFDISERRTRAGFVGIRSILKDSFKVIEKLYDKKEMITGVATGIVELDKLTSGFQPSDLIVIAGRPSMGKTALVLNIAEFIGVKSRLPVAVFSLEMSKEQLVMRMLSSRAKVDSNRLRNGFLTPQDWPRLSVAAGELSEALIFIDDSPSISVLEIRAKARRLKAEHDVGIIIIDYLQLIRGRDRVESRQQEISEISRSLKALAKELKVPVVALSQLSRAVETRGGDRRPLLSDLRESGAIEQDADVVAFIYREEVYKKDDEDAAMSDIAGKAEILVRKQRNGPTGTVHLTFLKEYTRFENQETRYHPEG
jgi:replicative DNA helicase